MFSRAGVAGECEPVDEGVASKPRSSGRTVHTLNHLAVSLAQIIIF